MEFTRARILKTGRPRAGSLAAIGAVTVSLAVAACGHQATAGAGHGASHASGRAGATTPAARAAGTSKFSAISMSFPSASVGWLLGVPPCAQQAHPCRTLLLRKTVDGGRSWLPAQAPPAPSATSSASPAAAVSQILFSDSRDGWAWGPGLWWTRDGGATWRRLRVSGGPVQSLAVAGRRVLAATGRCGQSDRWQCRFQVYTSEAGSGVWRPIPGARGGPAGPAGLVVSGPTGYVATTTGDLRLVILTGPIDGSARWRPLAGPCPGAYSIALATAPGGWLFLGCGSEPGAGQQLKSAYLSANGGRTWRKVASPPSGGYLSAASMTAGGTIMLSGGRMDVYISVNRGRSWYTSPSLDSAAGLAGAGWPLFATATSDTTGCVFQEGILRHQVWITSDGGQRWTPVTVR